MEQEREILLKSRKGFLLEIVGVVVCTVRVVKMKEHLPFCKEFSTICTEHRVVVERVV